MFGSLGVWEVLLILMVLLLVFGAKRLPELGGALGKGIREFKGSVRDLESEFNRTASAPDPELSSGRSQESAPVPPGSRGMEEQQQAQQATPDPAEQKQE